MTRTSVAAQYRTMSSKGLANGAASVVGAALTFAVTIVITRSYGTEGAGAFFVGLTVLIIVGTTTKLGAETALVYFIARSRVDGQPHRRLIAIALLPVLVASTAAAIVTHRRADWLAERFIEESWSDELAAVIRTFSWFTPAWALSLCLLGATRGAARMGPTALGLHLLQPALQLGLVTFGSWRNWPLHDLALAWAAPLAVTAAVGALGVLTFEHERLTADAAPPVSAVDFWAFAAPRGVAATLQTTLDRVGQLLVGALAPAALAGQWATIMRVIGLAQRVFHSIGQALNPRISTLAARQNWPEVARAVTALTSQTTAVLAPPLLAATIMPKAALTLFGEDFSGGASGLRIAALASLVAVLFAHADNIVLMAGRSVTSMIITAISLAISTALYALLVPSLDLVGAALALAAGIVVYRLASALVVHRSFGVHLFDERSISVAILAAAICGAPLALASALWGDRLPVALVVGALSTAVYAAVIFTRRIVPLPRQMQ